MALLEIKDLSVEFTTRNGIVKAVRNVNYRVDTGELLGIVGESGCRKWPGEQRTDDLRRKGYQSPGAGIWRKSKGL